MKNQIKFEQAKELIAIKTRQYAKRQTTWARSRMVRWTKIAPNKLVKSDAIDKIINPGINTITIIIPKRIDAITITNGNKALNIMELAGLIRKSSYIIGNDTGPAHIAAHLGKKGLVLFGYHTTTKKVSIETENLKVLTVDDLKDLSAEKVYLTIKDDLNSIIN